MSDLIHWHFHNPWRGKLTYVRVSDMMDLLPPHYVSIPARYGHKIDAYLLPQPGGRFSAGLRYGPAPGDYLSPHVDDRRAAHLYYEQTKGGSA